MNQVKENPFPYTSDNKRYYTWNHYLKTTFNQKVFKVALDAGFSCPHRRSDGKGGCTFCSEAGSGDFAGNRSMLLAKQFEEQKAMMLRKWPNGLAIAYFQAYTNTYAPLSTLKEIYEPFFNGTIDCLGVAIATRPDCLDDEIIEYLVEKNKQKPLYLEIGVQTIFNETSRLINRGHTTEVLEETLTRLKKTDIPLVLHIINSLPYESADMMIQTAKWVAKWHPFAIKIHMLHILKRTPMALQYQHSPFPILSKEEYIDIVVSQLEVLPEDIVIQRLTGDAPSEDLITPLWTLSKVAVLNDIDKAMVARNSWQGKYDETSKY